MSQDRQFTNKKILIVHFRVGKTDGVSLQIEAWQEMLEKQGAQVKLLAGPVSQGADYVIDDLEQQLNPAIYRLDENAFGGLKDYLDCPEFNQDFTEKQTSLRVQFQRVTGRARPDFLIVSNLFSVGENIPAAGALCQVLDKHPIPTLAVCHDFYWENERYNQPSCPTITQELAKFFPPQRDWLRLACINSIAQKELLRRKGLESSILYDTLDFSQRLPKKEHLDKRLLTRLKIKPGDIVVLQATRIVRRKNIELAIDLVRELQKPKHRKALARKSLFDGRPFALQRNRVVLLLSGYAEKRDQGYLRRLDQYARQQNVPLAFLWQGIQGAGPTTKKERHLAWSLYALADLITFPSEYEGFGNQFLEGILFQKPLAVFEYPVFKADIKPLGFEYISLGDKLTYDSQAELIKIPAATLTKAAKKTVRLLSDAIAYRKLTQHNLELGEKHFSYSKALGKFHQLLLR